MKRALTLVLLLLLPALARADAPERVVLILDRSASLRHADPTGRGPRLLALALALAARSSQTVTVVTTDGSRTGPWEVTDPADLARRLDAVLSAGPADRGGADFARALDQAIDLAGPQGLVVLYTDDDLDVIGEDGAPAAALERARASTPRPARDVVNRAAADLLLESLEGRGRPQLVGLRAPLPVRSVPILERLGAALVDLRLDGSDAEAIARLAAAIAGDAVVLRGDPLDRPLDLPWPARVGVSSPVPVEVPGGTALDAARRLWLLDAPAGTVAAIPGASAVILPRVDLPADVHAYALRDGVVRVVVLEGAAPPGAELAARAGASEAPLAAAGEGVWHADLFPQGQTEVEVLRVVARGGSRAVTARRRVTVKQADVVLAPDGPVRSGAPLVLRGALPPGLVPRRATVLEVRDAGGGGQSVPVELEDGALVARALPRAPGALQVTASGELPVRLAAAIEVGPEVERHLLIEGISAAWSGRAAGELAAGAPLDVTKGAVTLEVRLRLDPAPPEPLPLHVELEGAPAGAKLGGATGATIGERATLALQLDWPRELGSEAVTLRVRAGPADGGFSAGRALEVDAGPSWGRRAAAAGILLASTLWFVWLVRRRKRLIAQAETQLAERQVRAIAENGRMTFERYKMIDHSDDDLQVEIHPEDSTAGIELEVREDGAVKAKALDGAHIVHEDRPTILANEAILRHGTAFAVVHDNKARRYVYLDHEPSAEDLAKRYIDTVSVGEGEVRDSGVFVILDDDQNLASADAVPATSGIFSTASRRIAKTEAVLDPGESGSDLDDSSDDTIEDSHDAVVTIPDPVPSGRVSAQSGRLVSDEGIVIMDSDEAEIMDSQDVDMLPGDDEATRR